MPKVRSVFLSDIHLGTRACQADRLLDFLREHPAEQTFLIGDIVDFWAMSRSINWSPAQNTVVQKLLRRARHGDRVVFIPGNHDEVLRDYCGIVFGEVEVVDELVHETADGRRFLLIHGDQFDQVTRHHRWVAVLGDHAYELLVRINTLLSWGRRKLGLAGYWSRRSNDEHRLVYKVTADACFLPSSATITNKPVTQKNKEQEKAPLPASVLPDNPVFFQN